MKKHMKRCSISQIIEEMEIKASMRYHLTPARMAIIKKSSSKQQQQQQQQKDKRQKKIKNKNKNNKKKVFKQ